MSQVQQTHVLLTSKTLLKKKSFSLLLVIFNEMAYYLQVYLFIKKSK